MPHRPVLAGDSVESLSRCAIGVVQHLHRGLFTWTEWLFHGRLRLDWFSFSGSSIRLARFKGIKQAFEG